VLEDGLLPARDVWGFMTAATVDGLILMSPQMERRGSGGLGFSSRTLPPLTERERGVVSAMSASLIAADHFHCSVDPPADPVRPFFAHM